MNPHMSNSCEARYAGRAAGERGGARLKLLIFLTVAALIGYSLYQYVPVALQGYQFRDYMQSIVDRGALTGQTAAWVESQLRAAGEEYGVPREATISAQQREGRLEAHARFTRPVALPFYVYEYTFEHTVRSSSFLSTR